LNFINELLEKSPRLTTASSYAALNGVIYLIAGVTLAVWPGVEQTLFRDPDFRGHEGALMRVIGLMVLVIGWLYMCSAAAPAHGAASVVDRLVFVPLVLMPVAMAGVFPHMFIAFALLDASLAVGACWLMHRE